MSRFTKQAIVDSFLKLAAKKPFERITVRDIADECGVNRNTFYYHFSDIYELLNQMLSEKLAYAFDEERRGKGLSEAFLFFMEWVASNREAIVNIYRSIGRDRMEASLSEPLNGLVGRALRSELHGSGDVEYDLPVTVSVYRNIFFGALFDFLKGNLCEEPRVYFSRLSVLLREGDRNTTCRNSGDPKEKRSTVKR